MHIAMLTIVSGAANMSVFNHGRADFIPERDTNLVDVLIGNESSHIPTLPNIPAHPTLNALINSSLSPVEPGVITLPPQGSSAIPIVSPSNNIGSRTVNDAVSPEV
jgi:hypothetical protein